MFTAKEEKIVELQTEIAEDRGRSTAAMEGQSLLLTMLHISNTVSIMTVCTYYRTVGVTGNIDNTIYTE